LGRAEDDNRAKQAALDQQASDRERREEIDHRYQAEIIVVRQEASNREQTIRATKASSCPVPDAYRAYYDSVRRERADQASGYQNGRGRAR
jgi:hypothetical protein